MERLRARAAGFRSLALVCASLNVAACSARPAPPAPATPRETSVTPGAATPTDRADSRKRLRVLATNDFHGNLSPVRGPDGRWIGGAAALATYFALETRDFDGPVLLLDGGDIMQGTPLSNLTRGRSTIDYYNAVGYDAAALGNHEFDWGPDVLRERMQQARFAWLAANIVVAGSDTTPSWIRGTAIIEEDGVRVGVIGLITEDTPYATMAQYVAGLEFADGAETIDRLIPLLRDAGVDFVIVVAHAGAHCEASTHDCAGEMVDWLSRTNAKPDLVVAGHTHASVRTRISNVVMVETGSWGRQYGVVDLERVSTDSVGVWIRGTPVPWTDRVTPDSAVAALVARVENEVGPRLTRPIVQAFEEIPRGSGENPMGRLIADAQRAATGTQIAIMNAGGVRAPMSAGTVTWGDLYRIQPFGNKLMVLELTGATLRAALEHAVGFPNPIAHLSGIEIVYDPGRPAGNRIETMRLATGEPIRDDEVYSVTVSDFLATGVGDGFAPLADALESTATGIVDLDALIDYLQSLPQPVRAPTDARIHVINDAAVRRP